MAQLNATGARNNTDVIVFSLFFFIVGLFFGSFFGVLVDRLQYNKSFLFERSVCDHCKKPIIWYDLIPIFSFFLLGKQCRHCKGRLNWYYPLIEFVSGVAFLGVFLYIYYNTLALHTAFFLIFILSCLIVILFSDAKYGIIPDAILFPALLVSVLYVLFTDFSSLWVRLLTGIVAFLLFLAFFIFSKGKAMGFGDVKLSFFIGFLLGFPQSLFAFYLAFLTGGIVSFILIMWKKKEFKSTIAFGPFLVLGTLILLFFPQQTVRIFQTLLHL